MASIGVAATAHQLRHWFATQAYRGSRDLRVVQELLGHASPTTTAIYTAFSRTESVRAVSALELPLARGA
jgi:site-specific recombinase XerD